MVYNNLSRYLKEKYGTSVKKICIDGGFGCPNRDGTCGFGGCIFCGERGAGEHIKEGGIREQVERALLGEGKHKYIAYFQNFTNTYAPTSVLKERYDEALVSDRICALAIGTRPDCIDEDVAALLAKYKDRVDVWVELGLQTASDATAKVINRGYKTEVFLRAAKILEKHGIPFVVHTIIGLPGEAHKDVERTVKLLCEVRPFGVKIHSLYVMQGTRLGEIYLRGDYTPIGEDEYVSEVIYALTHLPPETIVHRITGDCPDGLLLAPEWSVDKSRIIERIQREMSENGLYQGIYCETV